MYSVGCSWISGSKCTVLVEHMTTSPWLSVYPPSSVISVTTFNMDMEWVEKRRVSWIVELSNGRSTWLTKSTMFWCESRGRDGFVAFQLATASSISATRGLRPSGRWRLSAMNQYAAKGAFAWRAQRKVTTSLATCLVSCPVARQSMKKRCVGEGDGATYKSSLFYDSLKFLDQLRSVIHRVGFRKVLLFDDRGQVI